MEEKDDEDNTNIGVGRYPVMPSLVQLQQMRNRLHLAYLGKKLMKWSALATGKEMRKIARRMAVVYDGLEEEIKMAYIMIARCRYYKPDLNTNVLEDVQKVARITFVPTLKICSGGIKYYEYEVKEVEPPEAAYPHLGIGAGGQFINETKNYWADLLKKLVLILELRTAFTAIELSHHNATKKKNVLQKVIIPRLVMTIRYILSELEEREREEVFRLKRFKQLKNKVATKTTPAIPETRDNVPLQKDPSVIQLKIDSNPKVTKVPPISKFHKSDLKPTSCLMKTPLCNSKSCKDNSKCLMDDENLNVLRQSDCKLCRPTVCRNMTERIFASTPSQNKLELKPTMPGEACDKSVCMGLNENYSDVSKCTSITKADRVTSTYAPSSPNILYHSCQEGLPIDEIKPSNSCCIGENLTICDSIIRRQHPQEILAPCPECCVDSSCEKHSMESNNRDILEVKKKLVIVKHIISKDGTYREEKTIVITEISTGSKDTLNSEESSASWDKESGCIHQKEEIYVIKEAKKPTSYSSSSGYTWTNPKGNLNTTSKQTCDLSEKQQNKSTNAYYVMTSNSKSLTNYSDKKSNSDCSSPIFSESYRSSSSVCSNRKTSPSRVNAKCPPICIGSIGNHWYYQFTNDSDRYSSDDENSCEDFEDALESSSISSSGSSKTKGFYMIKVPKIFDQPKTTFCFCASSNTNKESNNQTTTKIECLEQKFNNAGYTISFSSEAIKTAKQQIIKYNLPKLNNKTLIVTQQQSCAKSLDNDLPYTPCSSYSISNPISSTKSSDAKHNITAQELFYLVGRSHSLNVLKNTKNIICKKCLMELSNYIPISGRIAWPDCKLCQMEKNLQEKVEHLKRKKTNKRDSSSSAVETTEFRGQTSFERKSSSNETQTYSRTVNNNNFKSEEYRRNKEKFITEVINFESLSDISQYMNNDVIVQKDLDSNFLLTDDLMFTSFIENSIQEEENYEDEDEEHYKEELQKSSALIRQIQENLKIYSKFDNNQPPMKETNVVNEIKDKTGSQQNIVGRIASSINSISISQEFEELKKEVNQVLVVTSQSKSNDSPQYESSIFRKVRDNLFTPDQLDTSLLLYDPQPTGSGTRNNYRKKLVNKMKLREKDTNTDTDETEEKYNDKEHDSGLQLNEKVSIVNIPQLVLVEEIGCGSEHAKDLTLWKFLDEAVQTVDVGTNTKWRDKYDVRSLALTQ